MNLIASLYRAFAIPVARPTSSGMTMTKHKSTAPAKAFDMPLAALLLLMSGLALGGCVGAAVGAAATGGVIVSQERSVGDAVDGCE